MVRRASDMVMLLGSRGRSRGRSRSGFLQSVLGAVQSVLAPRSVRTSERSLRGLVPNWLALAAALVCFAGGFLAGDHFAAARSADPQNPPASLQASGGTSGGKAPGVLGEFDSKPLAHQAFIVSVYLSRDGKKPMAAAEAKPKAKALSEYLRGAGLPRTQPYEYPSDIGPLWVVAVYHDTEAEREQARKLLQGLPQDVPDEVFVQLRKTEEGWPTTWAIR